MTKCLEQAQACWDGKYAIGFSVITLWIMSKLFVDLFREFKYFSQTDIFADT